MACIRKSCVSEDRKERWGKKKKTIIHTPKKKMPIQNLNDGTIQQIRLLIANRGEISLRIQKSALLFPRPEQSQIEFIPFVIYTQEEKEELFVQNVPSNQRIVLEGKGPKAYLNGKQILSLAKQYQIQAIIPGYGFLSENWQFAKECQENGMIWCGPTIEQVRQLGDKVLAKQLAIQCQIPTLESTLGEFARLEEIQSFADRLGKHSGGAKMMMIKAVNGGGGRGMRIVNDVKDKTLIKKAFEACSRESKASFDDERVYAERFLEKARHIEVQIIGDGTGDCIHLWERECSVQRKNQKVIEIAPSPSLSNDLRNQIIQASLNMAKKVSYKSLGTFEFLCLPDQNEFYFMEINPRVQVEHTITEQITGKDLIAIQLCIAVGKTLNQLGLQQNTIQPPTSTSIQVRINAEKFLPNGHLIPTSGLLKRFNVPMGPTIRIDTNAHSPFSNQKYYKQTSIFDSLLAKFIFTAPTYPLAIQLTKHSLANSTSIQGFETNLCFVRALMESEQMRTNEGIHTRFIEEHFETLYKEAERLRTLASTKEDDHQEEHTSQSQTPTIPEGMQSIQSPLAGLVVEVMVKAGEKIQKGQEVMLVESMKMEHVIRSTVQGRIKEVLMKKGDSINENDPIVFIQENEEKDEIVMEIKEKEDPNQPRQDVQDLLHLRSFQSDQSKQKQVQRRHDQGYLTAKENIQLLIDKGSFIELGDLIMAAQRTRTEEEELREKTMNDGVITGWARVNGDLFDFDSTIPSNARCALCIYDYMVLAGTQGYFHHLKLDRLFRSILQNPSPLILYAEGGGGRPGDVDLINIKVGGLDTPSFALLAAIKARGYPTVGLANGYTFAGNAALLGTCDIVVATKGGAKQANQKSGITSTGMGGPAMIEGGGLGKVFPQDVGRFDLHFKNGDYDILVETEREASRTIKKLISFFQGPLSTNHWKYTKDENQLRIALPNQRTRAYEIRNVIELLSDDDSFIELGKGWGNSLITGLTRFAGQPIGILASSVLSPLGGAIDAESARKATRFIQLLHRTNSGHLLVLCDTPGFMVGTPAEKQGGLRSFADFFAAITQFQDGQNGGRLFSVTIRKAYGLGAQALLGGSTLSNFFSVAWPQGEFAAMGIEGAVRLGMRKELEAAKEGQERDQLFKSLVDIMYQRGKAQNMAAMAEIDTVIDPAETRKWLINGLRFTRQKIPTWKTDSHKHSSHL